MDFKDINNIMYDEGTVLAIKMKELCSQRHIAIANNVANINTPDYTRVDLEFEKKFSEAVKSGDIDQIAGFQAKLIQDTKNEARVDGNNVILSHEMNEMMQNNALSSLLGRSLNTRIKILKSAISSIMTLLLDLENFIMTSLLVPENLMITSLLAHH